MGEDDDDDDEGELYGDRDPALKVSTLAFTSPLSDVASFDGESLPAIPMGCVLILGVTVFSLPPPPLPLPLETGLGSSSALIPFAFPFLKVKLEGGSLVDIDGEGRIIGIVGFEGI